MTTLDKIIEACKSFNLLVKVKFVYNYFIKTNKIVSVLLKTTKKKLLKNIERRSLAKNVNKKIKPKKYIY